MTVIKNATGKPISNAAVVVRAVKDGKDDGNLEIKTDPDGKASLDVIETGSHVLLQVIASGYATYAEEFELNGASRDLRVALLKPREQVSAYEDNGGKASTLKPGVQEPKPHAPAQGSPTLIPRNGSDSSKPPSSSGANDDTGTSGSAAGARSPEALGTSGGEQGAKATQGGTGGSDTGAKQDPTPSQGAPKP